MPKVVAKERLAANAVAPPARVADDDRIGVAEHGMPSVPESSMSDERNRLGDKLHLIREARENQWAQQRDQEIIERLRQKYVKKVPCPECGATLDARTAIGLGALACPNQHGAWAEWDTLQQIRKRLENAAASHHESIGEKIFAGIEEMLEDLRRKHKTGIKCPDCGAELEARSAIGLGGMACPNSHGAWLDWATLLEIRRRLDAAAPAHGTSGSGGQSE
jgi:Zn-finger nucleic acid-binding protein